MATKIAIETIDLSVPENLQWAQDQWDQLVETNEWLRKRELDLLQQISELRSENAQLEIKLTRAEDSLGDSAET